MKWVIFDLDGTLSRTDIFIVPSIRAAMEDTGLGEWTTEEIPQVIHVTIPYACGVRPILPFVRPYVVPLPVIHVHIALLSGAVLMEYTLGQVHVKGREGVPYDTAFPVSPNASHIGCPGPQPACVGSHIHRVPAWIHDAHVHIPVYYIITYTSYLHVCLPTPVSSDQYSSFL